MRRLLRYLKGYEKETVLAPLFKMLEACFELLVPLVVAALVDTGIGRGDVPFIWGQFGILVLLAAVGLAASATAQYFAAKSALGYGTALRRDLFHHINTLSYSELDGVGTPTLVTRMTSDVNQLQNGVNMTLRLLLRCPFIVLGALLMSLTISVPMTLWFLGVTALITLVIVLVMRVTVPRYHEAQNTLDKVTLLTRENYAGARVVRAFSRQQDEIDAFTATNDKLKKVQTAAGRISALLNPATYVIVNLGTLAVLLRGGQFVDAGTLTQGQIIALISYLNQILTNLLRAADLVITITRAVASGIRVNELLNTATTMADPAAPELVPAAGAPAIAFEDVSFTYRGAGAPSLQGIGFSAAPGETVGVIGGTGSGKTTLIDLIARFYDAGAGCVKLTRYLRVSIPSRSCAAWSASYRSARCCSPAPSATTCAGPAPTRPTSRSGRRWEIAQAADFVHGKPGGLDEPVETAGRNFSGGQAPAADHRPRAGGPPGGADFGRQFLGARLCDRRRACAARCAKRPTA